MRKRKEVCYSWNLLTNIVFKCWDCQTLNVNSDDEPKREEQKRKISDVKKPESVTNVKPIETKTEEKIPEKLFSHLLSS